MIEHNPNWGQTNDGGSFSLFTLSNDVLRVQVTNAGAALVSVETPDRHGNRANVTVSALTPESYLLNSGFLGATVGRYANRIGLGKFWLEGQEYVLAVNNGPNHLHGGISGFTQRLWASEPGNDAVTFTYVSPDGEEGYPGTLTVQVTYRISGSDLWIEYSARCDAATVLNLTNHAFWNLSSRGSILDHQLLLFADRYLENDANTLPTGNILDVAGTPFDFRQQHAIGAMIDQTGAGYDNCYVINNWDTTVRQAGIVYDPASGRVMEVFTTEPGVQLYTANYFTGEDKSAGYQKHEAFCLECQHFPDSPNHPDFPSTALRPGDEYKQSTMHRFYVSN